MYPPNSSMTNSARLHLYCTDFTWTGVSQVLPWSLFNLHVLYPAGPVMNPLLDMSPRFHFPSCWAPSSLAFHLRPMERCAAFSRVLISPSELQAAAEPDWEYKRILYSLLPPEYRCWSFSQRAAFPPANIRCHCANPTDCEICSIRSGYTRWTSQTTTNITYFYRQP